VPAPPRRFLLVALGSTDDVNPLLALAAALRAAGHTVTLLEPDVEIPAPSPSLETLYASLAPAFAPLLEEVVAHLPQHDALVASHLFPFLKNAARAAGRPCADLVDCPLDVPFPHAAPREIPPPSWLPKAFHRVYQYRARRVHEARLDRLVHRYAGPALRAQALGKFHGFLRQPADCSLVTVSAAIFPPPKPPPPHYAYTGFLRGSAAPDAPAAAALAQVATLARSAAPVPVLTLDRLAHGDEAVILPRLLATWPAHAPLVLLGPHPDFTRPALRPEILCLGPMPLDDLFAFSTVIIHDGSSATTNAALHAGRAQIIVPSDDRSRYWARALQNLGVARVLDPATWPEQLTAAVDTSMHDISTVRRATTCASTLRAESGAALTVAALEKLF
jgi:UDP:flavonoid glycosyltransferase YjiC (YdhE family)